MLLCTSTSTRQDKEIHILLDYNYMYNITMSKQPTQPIPGGGSVN